VIDIARTLAAAAMSVAVAAPVVAEPTAQDRAGVQATIAAQIEAFGRDDAPAAYAIAADPIRSLFPSPDAFMAMVKAGYAPVHRPRSVVFGPISDGREGPSQEVLVTDSAGVDWIARYDLVRDVEGRWRILGCRLERNERDKA
jgi:hypothetical protein